MEAAVTGLSWAALMKAAKVPSARAMTTFTPMLRRSTPTVGSSAMAVARLPALAVTERAAPAVTFTESMKALLTLRFSATAVLLRAAARLTLTLTLPLALMLLPSRAVTPWPAVFSSAVTVMAAPFTSTPWM